MTHQGKVWLVGAGPGDPELITRKGYRLLKEADVVVHDRLVSESLVSELPPSVERIDVGKTPGSSIPAQTDINDLLIKLSRAGKRVVRLKGGDPYIFGRGAEERQALREAGCQVEVVPGISALTGATATAGVSLTKRGVSSTFAVMTGRSITGSSLSDVQWGAIAALDTVVVFMGVGSARQLQTKFIAAGRAPDTPVLLIKDGTLPTQQVYQTELGKIEETVTNLSIGYPTIIVIGLVAGIWRPDDTEQIMQQGSGWVSRESLEWLYDPSNPVDSDSASADPGLYPLTLTNLAGRRVFVAGGGRVGQRKVRRLLEVQARVVLCSPEATAEIQDRSKSGQVEWIQDCYRKRYLEGSYLAFAATDSHKVNLKVAQDASEMGVLCNVVTDTISGDFRVPAILETDGLLVSVSTVEGDPRRARYLRDRIRDALDADGEASNQSAPPRD